MRRATAIGAFRTTAAFRIRLFDRKVRDQGGKSFGIASRGPLA
jgi:hypothetical protein